MRLQLFYKIKIFKTCDTHKKIIRMQFDFGKLMQN